MLGGPAWDMLLTLSEINGRGRSAIPEELAEKISRSVSSTLRWRNELVRLGFVTLEEQPVRPKLSEVRARPLERSLDDSA